MVTLFKPFTRVFFFKLSALVCEFNHICHRNVTINLQTLVVDFVVLGVMYNIAACAIIIHHSKCISAFITVKKK